MYWRVIGRGENGAVARRTVMDEDGGELPLSRAKVGGVYRLVCLVGGQSFRERISSMGLNSGVAFRVITNSGHGPVGLEVRNTKLGIGRGMAERITVREIASR